MKKGTSFGTTTEIEALLAQKVCQCVPSCELVRFVSSGTEATMSAVRLARGFTKRSVVVTFAGGYHGHADCFLVKAGSGVLELSEASSAGIPREAVQNSVSLPYNDCYAFETFMKEHGDRVACVIVEPIAANMGLVPGSIEFLQLLRQKTAAAGSLLIFDEVVSGFRVAKGGAQELYRIRPDLSCFGKIVGGGFPAACFGGKKEIMSCLAPLGSVYQAGTLSGNPVAMQAGLEALKLLERPNFYQTLQKKMESITVPLVQFLQASNQKVLVQQVGSMCSIFLGVSHVQNMDQAMCCDREWFRKMFQYLFSRGVYIPPSQFETWFVTDAHTEAHLERTRDLLLEFFAL